MRRSNVDLRPSNHPYAHNLLQNHRDRTTSLLTSALFAPLVLRVWDLINGTKN
jgi:hypothetical protein